ncbi:MAG: hypothetical protein JOY66_17655 [Acetobacteraceae bacterium]|nr:hypothetical protein [Acetobacteraceae bacterium]
MAHALVRTGLAALLAGFAMAAHPARADQPVLRASLVACPSDKTVIGGVNACGKVWALGSGQADLSADGTLRVTLHGLVLNDASVGNANGTPDGVDAVAAALVCGGSAAAVAAQAEPVALSPKGDAQVEARLTMPRHCFAPVVIVRERYQGKIGGWLAATGF